MAIKITQALIYAELQTIKKTIEDHTVRDDTNFQELRRHFDGTEAAPGFKVRIDRIEQIEQGRKRHLGYVWSAIAALAAGLLTKLWNG